MKRTPNRAVLLFLFVFLFSVVTVETDDGHLLASGKGLPVFLEDHADFALEEIPLIGLEYDFQASFFSLSSQQDFVVAASFSANINRGPPSRPVRS